MKEKERHRADQTPHLGVRLSFSEKEIYRLIHFAGAVPITAEKLAERYYGLSADNGGDRASVVQIIYRARKKLGGLAIIRTTGLGQQKNGYLSWRAIIETFGRNYSNIKFEKPRAFVAKKAQEVDL